VRGLLAVAALLLLLGAAVAFHQATGLRPIGWSGLWQAVWAFDPMNFDHQTVMALRLPRLLAAFLAGAALGMAGVLLQSLLRNPLGEPHILGLNAGASLAVVVCLAFPLGVFSAPLLRPVVAATGGGLAFLLVLLLSSAGRLGLTMTKVTFCGIAVSALASTLTSGVLLLDEETLATVRLWLLGDAAAGTWTTVRAAAPLLLLALLAGWALAARLNVLALGDALATSLGVSLLKTRLLGLVVVAVLCGGAMLGLAGATLQSLTRNGLADPGLLGVREGASLAILVLLFFLPTAAPELRPLVGLVGGVSVVAVTVLLARGGIERMRFILIGIGVSWFLSGLIALMLVAADVTMMQTAMVWLAGSFSGAAWSSVRMAALCLLIGGVLLFGTARAGDVADLGDHLGRSLGVSITRLAVVRVAAAVLLTAGCVSFCGRLGFVGLIAPHLARLSVGGGQGALLSASALWGAGLVMVADTVGRVAFAPIQIPAGIVLAVIGVPVLLGLLWCRRDRF